MTSGRTLWSLAVALGLAAAALAWGRAGALPPPPDDGKELPAAELLVGVWSKTGSDHFKSAWWQSRRLYLNADGTWSISTNKDWRLFRVEQTRGTYTFADNVLHLTGPEFPDKADQVASGLGPKAGRRIKTWEHPVAVLTHDSLVILMGGEGADPPTRLNYRRVR